MTSWPPRDDAKQKAQKALDALNTGGKYLRENPIPIILSALVIGTALHALLRPPPRKVGGTMISAYSASHLSLLGVTLVELEQLDITVLNALPVYALPVYVNRKRVKFWPR